MKREQAENRRVMKAKGKVKGKWKKQKRRWLEETYK